MGICKSAALGGVGAFLLAGYLSNTVAVASLPAGVGDLAWSDEFNRNSGMGSWGVQDGGVWSNAINDNSSASLTGSALKITTHTETLANQTKQNYAPVLSTRDSNKQFKYGYFEASMQFHNTAGQWSAFWMNSTGNATLHGQQPGTPSTAGVEMDIAEHRTVDGSRNGINKSYNTALHWDGYDPTYHEASEKMSAPSGGISDDSFHTYALLWTPTSYTFYFDGNAMWTQAAPISDTPEYLILSSQVQDRSWAGNIPAGGYGSLGDSTTSTLVDYVRVYSLVSAPEPTAAAVVLVAAAPVLFGRKRRSC